MLRDKLQRFSNQLSGTEDKKIKGLHKSRYSDLAEALKAEIHSGASGEYLLATSGFDESYSHGNATIRGLSASDPINNLDFLPSDPASTLDLKRLLFLDTETTGLGGSGTVPFLIGLGSVTPDGFQVRQYFLPDYPDEAALLEAIRSEIKEDSIIVSYNGKAFDLPILSDRFIIHRIERNLNYAGHIDLLLHTRRIYRRRLQDCTLGNVEKEILSYYRYNDIPGYLVPSVYFNWLATGEVSELRLVMKHNLDDIVSLYFLLHHIAAVFREPQSIISEPDDILSIARIFQRRKDNLAVCRFLENFAPRLLVAERHDVLFLHSLSCKKIDDFPRAVQIWENIAAGSSPVSFYARIELAKYCEHRLKDIAAALDHSARACENCPPGEYYRSALARRMQRLKGKLSA